MRLISSSCYLSLGREPDCSLVLFFWVSFGLTFACAVEQANYNYGSGAHGAHLVLRTSASSLSEFQLKFNSSLGRDIVRSHFLLVSFELNEWFNFTQDMAHSHARTVRCAHVMHFMDSPLLPREAARSIRAWASRPDVYLSCEQLLLGPPLSKQHCSALVTIRPSHAWCAPASNPCFPILRRSDSFDRAWVVVQWKEAFFSPRAPSPSFPQSRIAAGHNSTNKRPRCMGAPASTSLADPTTAGNSACSIRAWVVRHVDLYFAPAILPPIRKYSRMTTDSSLDFVEIDSNRRAQVDRNKLPQINTGPLSSALASPPSQESSQTPASASTSSPRPAPP